MAPQKLAAGNWKMNGTLASLAEIDRLIADHPAPGCDVLICPPATLIHAMAARAGTALAVGGQDCHAKASGAHTGDIAAAELKDAGASHVILGHSERRTYFNETDETVNKKTKAALAHNLTPIVCCGETLEQREQGIMQSWIESQIEKALEGLTAADVKKVIIAYEPIWAIGTGKTASAAQAEEVCAIIRKKLAALYDAATAEDVSILYGGSVKGGNVAELTGSADIDGGLVGGASLKADDFLAIINNAVVK